MFKTKLIAALLVAGLAGCASQPPVTQAKRESSYKDALRQEIRCGMDNVSSVDDGISDAQTVAFALALRCAAEYDHATEKYGESEFDSETQRRMWRSERAKTSQKIKDFLPTVMDYRASLRKR